MFQDSIAHHLNEIRDRDYPTETVLIYKGFPNDFLEDMAPVFPPILGTLPFDTDKKIDLHRIEEQLFQYIQALGEKSTFPRMMLIEELVLVQQNFTNLDRFPVRFIIVENNLYRSYPNQSNRKFADLENQIEHEVEFEEDEIFDQFYSNAFPVGGQDYIQYLDVDEKLYKNVERLLFFPELEPIKNFKKVTEKELPPVHIAYKSSNSRYKLFKRKVFFDEIDAPTNLIIDENILHFPAALDELSKLDWLFKQAGLELNLFLKVDRHQDEFRPELNTLLEQYWGSKGFRTLKVYKEPDLTKELVDLSQGAIVEYVIEQVEKALENGPRSFFEDVFLTAPTGAGKSLLFQMPAIYISEKYEAVTIVISPLIALMKDQVIAMKRDRNYHGVAYINSELSLVEREDIIARTKSGEISILYMSPELLLSYALDMFIGNRRLGLLVIDEAHLVTTWGRDFRVDYWYLGNYIRKIRKYYDHRFPVMALTATAVFSGKDDMVFETIDSLNLQNSKIFLGNVRRDNIGFDIRKLEIPANHVQVKLETTKRRIEEFINKKEKTLFYFPWTSQIREMTLSLGEQVQAKTGRYYGSMHAQDKQESFDRFLHNEAIVMLATKAFGMGVDISDIQRVYHHAPSGNLSDYVQEIGRVARIPSIQGVAALDFNPLDLKFTKILYGLSSIKQYQVNMVLSKLNNIFLRQKQRNFLVSVDDFQHIFPYAELDLDQKVKSTLLLLEKDLIRKYRYNVIVVRPKSLYTTVFARVNIDDEPAFVQKYSAYVKKIEYPDAIEMPVYRIQLDKIWENYFSKVSFPRVKRSFFEQDLFSDSIEKVSPQVRLNIFLNEDVQTTLDKLEQYFSMTEKAFEYLEGYFTKEELADKVRFFFVRYQEKGEINENIDVRGLSKRIADLFTSIYASNNEFGENGTDSLTSGTFIQTRRSEVVTKYRIVGKAYRKTKVTIKRVFNKHFGSLGKYDRTKEIFIPTDQVKNVHTIKLAYILESFDLASYEIAGGETPQIFIRINDPMKIQMLSRFGYRNELLRDIDRRHHHAVQIMQHFFTTPYTDQERWDLIEAYFLGNEVLEMVGKEAME